MTPKPWQRLNPATWLWPLPAIVAWVLCWTLFRTVWEQGLALHWSLALYWTRLLLLMQPRKLLSRAPNLTL